MNFEVFCKRILFVNVVVNNGTFSHGLDFMKILTLILLMLPAFASAEIYKWVDENGRVHFGDSPKEKDKAEKVVVDVVSYEFVKVEPVNYSRSTSTPAANNKVVMYSASWCGYCKKARSYFMANNIDFIEYDIERDGAAARRFREMGGKGVPVILVGDRKMSGFSIDRFQSIYQ